MSKIKHLLKMVLVLLVLLITAIALLIKVYNIYNLHNHKMYYEYIIFTNLVMEMMYHLSIIQYGRYSPSHTTISVN